jgi:putative ABC transport system permease protein
MITLLLNLFRFVGLRHLQLKPARTILTILGVSLGIMLFVGINVINQSTLSAFRENIDAVAGKAQLTVSAGDAGFSETILEKIEKTAGIRHSVPMIEARGFLAGPQKAGQSLVILGVDLLREQSVRTYKMSDEQVVDDPLVFLNQPDSIILTREFAREHGLALDSTFELATANGKKRFTVRGLLSPQGPARAYGGAIALMDIDGARMTFGKEGKIDRVDLVLKEGIPPENATALLRERLGESFRIERPEGRSESMERMVEAFQKMLQFFSTLALLVGIFLVANSISISVAERRKEIATLRALGASRRSVLTLFLSEAAAMGAMGALLGAFAGRVFAGSLIGLVTRAMSSQYLTPIQVQRLTFGAREVLLALALGASASLLAALWPALRATRIHPLEALKTASAADATGQKSWLNLAPWVGTMLLIYVWIAAEKLWGIRYPWLEPLNQAAAMIGSALVAPAIVSALLRAWGALAAQRARRSASDFSSRGARSQDILSRLSRDQLLRNPQRTGVNVMSLMVGLMLVILVASVNVSFRTTIMSWFGKVLRADLLVSSQGRMISYQTQPLHEKLGWEIAKIPGLVIAPGKPAMGMRFIHLDYNGIKLGMKAWDRPIAGKSYSAFVFKDFLTQEAAQKAGDELYDSKEPVVFVSENFTLRHRLGTGDFLELKTPSGILRAKIIGIVTDFASPEGVVYMSRDQYKRYWQDPLVSVFALEVAPGASAQEVRKSIDATLGSSLNLTVVSNAEIKQQLTETIDQSFAYTSAIQVAALLVGLLGLINTLLISVLERTREIGMMRAVGMTRVQLIRMILQESCILGALGAVAAILLGSWLAWLWVTHTQAHILGWIVAFHFPWSAILTTLGAGIGVALLAGFFPARRAAYFEICDALDYD